MKKFIGQALPVFLLCILALSVTVSCDKSSNGSATTDTTDSTELTTNVCAHEETKWIVDQVATCAAEGSKHNECLACKATLETAALPSIAHTETIVEGKPATCSEAGLTEGKSCSACHATLVKQEEIPMIQHTEVIIDGKAYYFYWWRSRSI